jgi:hypothetical protein
MPSGVKVYQIKDFIRMSESGEIDFDKSIRMVRELAAVTAFNSDHNILLDLRKTKVSFASMEEAMKITLEFVQCMPPDFKNKIANVIPDDTNRASLAKKFELCMNIQKINYKFFTEFEDAIEWLADAKYLK